MARRLLPLVAALAALSGSAPAVALVSGEQHLLVIRATWGPKPFTNDQVQESIGGVDAFYRASSFGRVSFTGTVTPWLKAYAIQPQCNVLTIVNDADAAARAAGYDLSAYDETAYLFPELDCPWTGSRWGTHILLNGTLTVVNTAHELGHVFGLPHAQGYSCAHRQCDIVNLGDPYDTMGSGTGDFGSYGKWLLGWIRVRFAGRSGRYEVAPLEAPSRLQQGFVVTTARRRYWLEVRREPGRDEQGNVQAPAGLLVHIGPNPDLRPDSSPFGLASNVLVLDPAGRGSPPLRPGDIYGERGTFRIHVLKPVGTAARLRFTWIDTTAPRRPAIVFPGPNMRTRDAVTVTWHDSVEAGSGVARYEVSLDDHPAVSIQQQTEYGLLNTLKLGHVTRGAHKVTIVGIDRAGNRSRPATRRFVVTGRE